MTRAADFERALLTAIPDPRSRLAAIAVLARFRGKSVYLPTPGKKERRQQAAANMLRTMAPAEVADVLRERWNISERTARRDVKEARTKSAEK